MEKINPAGAENYFGSIFVKTNAAECLDRELSSPKWKGETINLGGVTDSYQRAEAKYQIMPDIWRVLIRHRNPVVISTKSDLILRDYELIAELAQVASVNIAVTITTVDYEMQHLLEPGAVDPDKRFTVLREFSKVTRTGLHMMPVIPYITDSYDNIDTVFDCAARCNVSYVLPGTLYLRGLTREKFFEFIAKKLPYHYAKLQAFYGKDKTLASAYKKTLYSMIYERLEHYGFPKSYPKT